MLKKFNKAKRLKTHGFLERMSTKGGRKVLGKRREKGRHQIVVGVHSK